MGLYELWKPLGYPNLGLVLSLGLDHSPHLDLLFLFKAVQVTQAQENSGDTGPRRHHAGSKQENRHFKSEEDNTRGVP